MMVIARHDDYGEPVVSLSRVAAESDISRRYLEQLVIGLKNSQLIRGKTGKGGGYSLARPADEIKLRHIVESAIGPISIVDCVIHPETCEKSDICPCRKLYRLVNHQITSTLDGLALSDLTDNEHMTSLVCALDTYSPATTGGEGSYCE
jgi:Rrf2 family protein